MQQERIAIQAQNRHAGGKREGERTYAKLDGRTIGDPHVARDRFQSVERRVGRYALHDAVKTDALYAQPLARADARPKSSMSALTFSLGSLRLAITLFERRPLSTGLILIHAFVRHQSVLHCFLLGSPSRRL
jgi:hypothetical protein